MTGSLKKKGKEKSNIKGGVWNETKTKQRSSHFLIWQMPEREQTRCSEDGLCHYFNK